MAKLLINESPQNKIPKDYPHPNHEMTQIIHDHLTGHGWKMHKQEDDVLHYKHPDHPKHSFQVYGYKWEHDAGGQKTYTGKIYSHGDSQSRSELNSHLKNLPYSHVK
jgi:hypothetical protein